MQEEKNLYSNYDLNDWRWEFLKRNPRYIKAYKAVEWLKKRLDKNKQIGRTSVRFNVFGIQCLFDWFKFSKNGRHFEGWEYHGSRYRTKNGKVCTNTLDSRLFLDLPSPDDSSAHYKEKLLNKEEPVYEIGNRVLGDHSSDAGWPRLEKYEIAVAIDTRYNTDEIVKRVRDIVSDYQEDNRHHIELYSDYLRVWQLRKDKISRSKIASLLWPGDYNKNKAAAIQKTRNCEQKFQVLIDDSFPEKKRFPKSRNKPHL